ncbi:MAG: 16S rRNA (cytosine(1402)-N(4))-methyltransferase RsmH [Thermonemataceae bacterium]|nr:16S rRNA (cytosine(1402)-N(4))-methyltransferase RsmH [Thermonemataceae bacterium]
MSNYHNPVLLKESVEALNLKPKGVYVDVTFGGGGHSAEILAKIPSEALLIAFDQDADAWENAHWLVEKYPNFTLIKKNFRELMPALKSIGINKIDGLLADLGVSSHQFDTPERGFSFRFEAELDMRMNQTQQIDAKFVLNQYTERDLHRIFGMYGEIKNAKTLAKVITTERKKHYINTTQDLRSSIESCIPKKEESKYLAQLFQALRIEVNEELKALEEMLMQTKEVVSIGGRIVLISYHSLEDRLAKNFLQKGKFYGEVEKDFFGNEIKPFKTLEKLIVPTEAEIKANPRARSAKMRVAERI